MTCIIAIRAEGNTFMVADGQVTTDKDEVITYSEPKIVEFDGLLVGLAGSMPVVTAVRKVLPDFAMELTSVTTSRALYTIVGDMMRSARAYMEPFIEDINSLNGEFIIANEHIMFAVNASGYIIEESKVFLFHRVVGYVTTGSGGMVAKAAIQASCSTASNLQKPEIKPDMESFIEGIGLLAARIASEQITSVGSSLIFKQLRKLP
ncbi:hypothetical protein V757_11640 [Pelistega indica]|uniref:Uncharacterized protein n=1 Tax=Pelistega indica TaxID=1414851 RepID=V8FS97_9BURK|nr:hypothetical protein [Pelistega indica]ETD67174.1 hypothetical protein V757_11640 [Pelistega indica]